MLATKPQKKAAKAVAKRPAKQAAKRTAKRPAEDLDAPDEQVGQQPPPHIMGASIVGMSELHQFLGVKQATVNRWSTLRRVMLRQGRIADADRKLAPYDYPSINGHPAWDRKTILKWAAENGKIEDGGGERAPWLKAEAQQWMPQTFKRPRRTKAEMRADEERLRRASGADPDS